MKLQQIATAELTQSEAPLEELAERFIAYVDVSELTVKSYNAGIRKFLHFLSENGITSPTRETILEYKKFLMAQHTAGTVATCLSSIRRFFEWLESERLYPNITSGVKSPKIGHEHKRDCFSAEQVGDILSSMSCDTLQCKRDYAIFVLASACGLRTCEIVRADVGDIHNVMGNVILNVRGKGRSDKTDFVKLPPEVLEAIRDYLSARGDVADDEPLFASCSNRNKGKRLTTRTISGVCKGAMVKAGFNSRRLTAHSLRHTAITLALLEGNKLDEASAFARHSSIAVTMIYNHSVQRLKSLCETSIAAAIFRRVRRI